MAIDFHLSDFAQLVGAGQYTANSSLLFSNIVGTPTSLDTSWTAGELGVGQQGFASQFFSNGYVAHITLSLIDVDTVDVTSVSLELAGNQVWSWTGDSITTRSNYLANLQDAQLFSGNDFISGNSFDNALEGWAGNDTLDGGSGTDTAVYSNPIQQSVYSRGADGTATVSSADGVDTLINIERLQFTEKAKTNDDTKTTGQAYRLYQAAFNRAPDLPGLGYQLNDLDHVYSLTQVASNFIASPEFQATYGNVDDTQFISLLYKNVLHRDPDPGGLQFHLDEIASHQTRADVLVHFSESPENQANVIGAIAEGILYVPLHPL